MKSLPDQILETFRACRINGVKEKEMSRWMSFQEIKRELGVGTSESDVWYVLKALTQKRTLDERIQGSLTPQGRVKNYYYRLATPKAA